MIGQTISHYKITSKLGEGGMGEVYRATDTKLNRDVALKVLPDAFAADRERMARFSREAQVLASLNHPNIASIYGLEDSDHKHALVLELVEGETLAERIKGEEVPLEESLKIALQMAEALEAAHEKGIIHRDLKPANVKITPEGKVKVLDFGLAKALEPELSQQEVANSPTVTMEGTQPGVVLGTAGYMSPEQARGQAIDRRTDIWAFGCVLYEMLTGKQVFGGATATDILGAIVHKDPDWEALPETTPRAIHRLLRRCLERDPHERLQHIGDARLVIRHVISEPLDDSQVSVSAPVWRRAIPSAPIGLLMVLMGLLLGYVLWNTKNDSQLAPPAVTRFPIALPDDEEIPQGPALALSPDGTQVVYAAIRGNTRRLYLRSLNQLGAKEIPGTESSWAPFFSPNGQWVGFFDDVQQGTGELKRWSVLGGDPVTICAVGTGRGASWGEDDTIIFGKDSGLWRVSSSGGTPEPVIPKGSYFYPQILPGGKGVLFQTGEPGKPSVGVLSLDSGQQSILVDGGLKARYVPTGHLVYGLGNSVLAAPFDLDSLGLRGAGVPVVDGVWNLFAFVLKFEVSRSGSLVYVPKSAVGRADKLVWVDRHGTEELFLEPRMGLYSPRLSPDGRRLAVQVTKDQDPTRIWTCEMELCVLSPLALEVGYRPVWNSDSADLFFDDKFRAFDLWRIAADGTGKPERLLEKTSWLFAGSVSPDGKVLAFMEEKQGNRDILVLWLDGDKKVEPFHVTEFNEHNPTFSPDGGWIAFTSNRSGKDEIYVKRYPPVGDVIPITADGGSRPLWSPNGEEIFYRNGKKMMSVSVNREPDFRPGKRRKLFEWQPLLQSFPTLHYDVAPDGQRFLMLKRGEESLPTQINVVLNWAEELKQKVPIDN